MSEEHAITDAAQLEKTVAMLANLERAVVRLTNEVATLKIANDAQKKLVEDFMLRQEKANRRLAEIMRAIPEAMGTASKTEGGTRHKGRDVGQGSTDFNAWKVIQIPVARFPRETINELVGGTNKHAHKTYLQMLKGSHEEVGFLEYVVAKCASVRGPNAGEWFRRSGGELPSKALWTLHHGEAIARELAEERDSRGRTIGGYDEDLGF